MERLKAHEVLYAALKEVGGVTGGVWPLIQPAEAKGDVPKLPQITYEPLDVVTIAGSGGLIALRPMLISVEAKKFGEVMELGDLVHQALLNTDRTEDISGFRVAFLSSKELDIFNLTIIANIVE